MSSATDVTRQRDGERTRSVPFEWMTWVSGWRGAAILGLIYVAGDVLTIGIGGNIGSFLFVTWHFIVAPLLAVSAIVFTLRTACGSGLSPARRILTLSSVAIPLMILLIAFRGDPGVARWLNIA